MLARVLHLVRHDLKSVAPLLGVWVGVLALESLVLWVGPPAPDPASRQAISLDVAALVIRWAVTVVLVTTLVHRHPLVGTTAFWRTRPMPRLALLSSKSVEILLLLVLVPGVWMAATFWALGVDLPLAAMGAAYVCGEQVLVASLVAGLATVCTNLAQVVVAGTALVVGFLQWRMLFPGQRPRPAVPLAVTLPSADLAEFVVLGIPVILLAAVAAHQALTLRRWRSISLLAGCFIGYQMLFYYPVWRVGGSTSPTSGDARVEAPQLEFVPPPTVLNRPAGDVSYSAQVRGAGPPGAVILAPQRVRTTATFADGETVIWTREPATQVLDPGPVPGGGSRDEQPYPALAAAAGTPLLVDPRDVAARRYGLTFFAVSSEDFARKRSTPATLDIALTARAYRFGVAARMPVRRAGRASGSDTSWVFYNHFSTDDGVAFDVSDAWFYSLTDRGPTYYLLRNPAARESLLLVRAGEASYRTSFLFWGGLTFTRRRLEAQLAGRAALAHVSDNWVRDAEVLVVSPETLGTVDRTIRLEHFVLDHVPGLSVDPAGALRRSGGAR